MIKRILFLSSFAMLFSCGSDDDICLSADSTPRLKLEFRNDDNQIVNVDTLYVDVDYGKGCLTSLIKAQANVNTVLIPLRVDDNTFTDIYFRSRKEGPRSKIRIGYESKAIYVSPACGFKKNYENLTGELLESDPVIGIEPVYNRLTDENKTNFYLRF